MLYILYLYSISFRSKTSIDFGRFWATPMPTSPARNFAIFLVKYILNFTKKVPKFREYVNRWVSHRTEKSDFLLEKMYL